MSRDPEQSEERRAIWERSLEALNARRAHIILDLHQVELQIVELSTKLGRDFSHLLKQELPRNSYVGWPPGDAVRDYLRQVGEPLSPEVIVEALEKRGANPGHVKRAIANALKAPGTRKDGTTKTPGLKLDQDGKIGLPEWPV